MPTADPSNVLFKIAHPDLYERNPFNVLNLQVDATAKDIRRRKEDIEAAFDAGTEAEEFRNILPGDETRPTPTREQVAELFSALEDPEKRIAYALFWFWPEPATVEAGRSGRRHPNPNGEFGHRSIIAKWEEEASSTASTNSSKVVARHNLAVFHQMMGLAYELALLNYDTQVADTPPDVSEHWKAAINWWNDVSDQPDFWHVVSENVSALGDPRLDFRFVRALKDQFAFAFDQINVELAIDFAKHGREADARRQVEYMKLSQPDSDDVEGTFDNAFAGLLRHTEAVVKAACGEMQKDPKSGLAQANTILSQTDESLRVSRIVLPPGASIRNAIFATVFTVVRSCLIACGNEAKDWDGCLALSVKLKTVAESPEQTARTEADMRILEQNKKKKEEEELCWFCKKEKADHGDELSIEMYGEVHPSLFWRIFLCGGVHITWKTYTLHVQRCRGCHAAHTSHVVHRGCALVGIVVTTTCIAYIVSNVISSDYEMVLAVTLSGPFLGLLLVVVMLEIGIQFPYSYWSKNPSVGRHPVFQAMQKQGWKVGKKPYTPN